MTQFFNKATYATAIKAINPNAKVLINGDLFNYDNIQWLENTTPISKDVLDAKLIECQTNLDNAKAQKEADALAGNNKLLALGLSQAEVTAMTGYTPPVSE